MLAERLRTPNKPGPGPSWKFMPIRDAGSRSKAPIARCRRAQAWRNEQSSPQICFGELASSEKVCAVEYAIWVYAP
jgi:hypothetical protein